MTTSSNSSFQSQLVKIWKLIGKQLLPIYPSSNMVAYLKLRMRDTVTQR